MSGSIQGSGMLMSTPLVGAGFRVGVGFRVDVGASTSSEDEVAVENLEVLEEVYETRSAGVGDGVME